MTPEQWIDSVKHMIREDAIRKGGVESITATDMRQGDRIQFLTESGGIYDFACDLREGTRSVGRLKQRRAGFNLEEDAVAARVRDSRVVLEVGDALRVGEPAVFLDTSSDSQFVLGVVETLFVLGADETVNQLGDD